MMDTPLQRSQINYLHWYSLWKKQVSAIEDFGGNTVEKMSTIEATVEEVMIQ